MVKAYLLIEGSHFECKKHNADLCALFYNYANIDQCLQVCEVSVENDANGDNILLLSTANDYENKDFPKDLSLCRAISCTLDDTTVYLIFAHPRADQKMKTFSRSKRLFVERWKKAKFFALITGFGSRLKRAIYKGSYTLLG